MSGMSMLGSITSNQPTSMSQGGGEGSGGEGGPEAATRARKSPNAFRTISEVAEDLHVPQHVLRFWETKFPQLKPLKRGGGRRYYRPEDITLLRRIGDLLYTQGYTIKGVQRLLREGGIEGMEAASDGDLSELPPEGTELRACLAELEAIASALRLLALPR
jgi:DNA-binding transcriptional MerR regulator